MELSRTKLSKFDLETDLEKRLLEEDREKLVDFFSVIQNIQTVDQFIRDCPSFPGSNEEIIREELISAIGATLAIEGTILRPDEIEESFQKADLQKDLERKEQEAQNSRNVYRYITELVSSHDPKTQFTYTQEHIKQIHQYFTENIDYVGNTPGEYRDMTAMFGEPRRISLYKSRAEIYDIMPKFLDWLNKSSSGLLTGHPIVKAIMAHYYFVEIHPFGDGNGRTARALEALVLYLNRINPYCFWSLANFWSTHRNEYIVHLGNIRATCEPWAFLMWGMKGYLGELERVKGLVLKKVKQLMLMDYVQWLHREKRQQKPERKINQRIIGALGLLTRWGKVPLDWFVASPEITSLYSGRVVSTRYRDFEKMSNIGLIRISRDGAEKYIEPNYQLLEHLEYNV